MGSLGCVALCVGLCVLHLNTQPVRATSLRSDDASVAAVVERLSSTVLALEAKFTSQEAKLASQKATITSQGAKIASHEATITSQGAKLASQEATITSQGAKITSQGASIAQLQVENKKRIAFSVYISTGGHPVQSSAKAIVPFAGTISNVGHAFNTATSVFTCPFDGDYFFAISLDVSKDYENMSLHKNGHSFALVDRDDTVSTHLSANAVVTLKAGDVVTVVHNHSVGHVDEGNDSIFTGFLVK